MSDISVVVVDSNSITAIVDQGVIGPTGATGPQGPIYGVRVITLPDANSSTMNADTTDTAIQYYTGVAGTFTINAPTGTITNGQKLIWRLRTTNIQTFSWNAVFAGSTDVVLPGFSTGSGKYDYMGFIYNSQSSTWQIIARAFGY